MKCIQLFGASGSGKSTIASGLFYKMKLEGYKVELVNEFAKTLVYEERLNCLKDQFYVTGIQNHCIERLVGKVDFLITDSPILLGALYAPKDYPESFKKFLFDMFNKYENINIYLNRKFEFSKDGRRETEEESSLFAVRLKKFLIDNNVSFTEFDGDVKVLNKIWNFIKKFKE